MNSRCYTPRMKPLSARKTTILSVLDVGTSKVACLIARLMPAEPSEMLRGRTHRCRILGIGHQRSVGLKGGAPYRGCATHGWALDGDGRAMSKSVGNVIDPFTMTDAYGVDQVRFFFLREVPFGQDGSYSHEAIVNRTNAELANDLGNLAQRSMSMIGKQLGGVLPAPVTFSDNDKTILAAADAMIGAAREHMKTLQLHQVLNTVWAVVADENRYFTGEAPWALAKTDPARRDTVLWVLAETIRRVTLLVQPFMPGSTGKILDQLAVADRSFAAFDSELTPGTELPKPQGVFPRFVETPKAA